MQRVVTPDGWIIPLHIRNVLAYMDMRPPTQDKYETYDHVVLASDVTWDLTVLDNEVDLSVPNDNLMSILMRNIMMHARQTLGRRVPNALLRKCSGTVMNMARHCH